MNFLRSPAPGASPVFQSTKHHFFLSLFFFQKKRCQCLQNRLQSERSRKALHRPCCPKGSFCGCDGADAVLSLWSRHRSAREFAMGRIFSVGVLRSVISTLKASACAMSKFAHSLARSVRILTSLSQPMSVEREHFVEHERRQTRRSHGVNSNSE